MTWHHLMLFVHVTGVSLWLGGLAFLSWCWHPVLRTMSATVQLQLWQSMLKYFFPYAWLSMSAIIFSGGWMLWNVGVSRAPWAWHAMTLSGSLMIALFIRLRFYPWPDFVAAMARKNGDDAQRYLIKIKWRLRLMLEIGLFTLLIATLGLGWTSL